MPGREKHSDGGSGLQFRLTRVSGSPVTDDELLADLQRVARELGTSTVPQKRYAVHGTYNYSTLERRFGSWNNALRAAGLSLSTEVGIPDDRLFENLLVLWQHYGRQPRRVELAREPSRISQTPYMRRFRSWTAALEAFVEYANSSPPEYAQEERSPDPPVPTAAGVSRQPSLRLRWRVLQRDRFKCCACGASPALTPGVELHVDHIVPWKAGGETIEANLQTLCAKCNLGKSDSLNP